MLYICYYYIVIVIFYLVFTVRTSSLELFVRLLCEINWIEIEFHSRIPGTLSGIAEKTITTTLHIWYMVKA